MDALDQRKLDLLERLQVMARTDDVLWGSINKAIRQYQVDQVDQAEVDGDIFRGKMLELMKPLDCNTEKGVDEPCGVLTLRMQKDNPGGDDAATSQ